MWNIKNEERTTENIKMKVNIIDYPCLNFVDYVKKT